MGCGSSSVKEIEMDEFVKIYDENNKKYQKIAKDEKNLELVTENTLTKACEQFIEESELEDLLSQITENFDVKNMKQDDIKNAVLLNIARVRINREIKMDLVNDGDFLNDYIENVKQSDKKKLIEYCISNVGAKVNFLHLNFENEEHFLLNSSIDLLTFSPEYSKLNTLVLTIQERDLTNPNFIKALSCFIKNHSSLKSLFLGISDDQNQKPIREFNNLFYIFEALALSKTLKNFSLIRLLASPFTIENNSLKRVENALRISKLSCLIMINLSFKTPEHRLSIIEAIGSNSMLEMFGIQIVEFKNKNVVSELLPKFIFGQNLKYFNIGEYDSNDNMKEYEPVIKKNNPKLEVFSLAPFKTK